MLLERLQPECTELLEDVVDEGCTRVTPDLIVERAEPSSTGSNSVYGITPSTYGSRDCPRQAVVSLRGEALERIEYYSGEFLGAPTLVDCSKAWMTATVWAHREGGGWERRLTSAFVGSSDPYPDYYANCPLVPTMPDASLSTRGVPNSLSGSVSNSGYQDLQLWASPGFDELRLVLSAGVACEQRPVDFILAWDFLSFPSY